MGPSNKRVEISMQLCFELYCQIYVECVITVRTSKSIFAYHEKLLSKFISKYLNGYIVKFSKDLFLKHDVLNNYY